MARYDLMRVPRGPTRKWEVVMEDEPERPIARMTAADVKHQHRLLRDIPAPELQSIPLLPTGAALERGARYVDLHDPARGEFTGGGHEHVRPGQRVISRGETPPEVWRAVLDAADRVLGRAPARRAK